MIQDNLKGEILLKEQDLLKKYNDQAGLEKSNLILNAPN